MHLVLPTGAGRLRRNNLILAILLLWPVCSLAQSQRADGAVAQNDPGLTGMHDPPILPAPRKADAHADTLSRPEDNRAGRKDPVFPLSRAGWFNATAAGMYFAQKKGYLIRSVVGYRFGYRYRAGLGAAIDQYTIRTLPVFCHLSADLSLRKTTPFAYADPGIAFPWPREDEYPYNGKPDQKLAGWHLEAGLGQRLRLGAEGQSLELSAGYSLETLRFRYRETAGMTPTGGTAIAWETYSYNFQRIVLALGITL